MLRLLHDVQLNVRMKIYRPQRVVEHLAMLTGGAQGDANPARPLAQGIDHGCELDHFRTGAEDN